jgi:hypothetical protein
MTSHTRTRRTRLAILALALAGATTALAAPRAGGPGLLDLSWHTVDGGGGSSAGGGFELAGTIGQADAGISGSGTMAVAGGFWSAMTDDIEPPCPGDLSGDATVDGADLGLLLGNWGGSGTGDLNGDTVVDGADLGLLLGAWGSCT